MISRNVKSVLKLKVDKLHSIPIIKKLATHDSHGRYKDERKEQLSPSKRQPSERDPSFDLD